MQHSTKKIQQKYQSFKISFSHTTRSARSNEVEGVDYFFVSQEKFEQLIKEKKLQGLESNQNFIHLNTFEMYKKILSLNFTD